MKKFRWIFTMVIACTTLWSEEFQVTTLDDSSTSGTFRFALENVQENGIIIFDASLNGGVILLSSNLPPIDVSIKIFGPPGFVTINGNNLFSVFQINAQEEVKIEDLLVTNANTSGSGSGLFTNSFAKVIYVGGSFTNCHATGTEGGAVHIGQDAVVNFVDTTFSSNSSGGFGNDIFLNTGSTLLYKSLGDVSPIDVFGTGNLFKSGLGSVTFTIPSSTALALIAQEGDAISTGVRTEPTIVIEGARLEGVQTSLYIINHGTLKPSTSIGTTTATGDYHQAPAGTLEIAITPSTTDLLEIGGNAFLQGSLFIDPETGAYTTGTKYTILTTGGSVSQQFTSVSSSNGTFQVNYFSDRVEIEVVIPPM